MQFQIEILAKLVRLNAIKVELGGKIIGTAVANNPEDANINNLFSLTETYACNLAHQDRYFTNNFLIDLLSMPKITLTPEDVKDKALRVTLCLFAIPNTISLNQAIKSVSGSASLSQGIAVTVTDLLKKEEAILSSIPNINVGEVSLTWMFQSAIAADGSKNATIDFKISVL